MPSVDLSLLKQFRKDASSAFQNVPNLTVVQNKESVENVHKRKICKNNETAAGVDSSFDGLKSLFLRAFFAST